VLVNRVEVDPDFRFFCPMTGELVTGPEDYGPSAATAFLLGPDASEFDYLAPDLEPIWREVQEAHPSLARSPAMLLDEFCRQLERHANLVLFSLSASGVGCGPVTTTVHVCIDFSYVDKDVGSDADDGADDEEDDEDEEEEKDDDHFEDHDGDWVGEAGDAVAEPLVPLPRHLPLAAFDALLTAYCSVTEYATDESDLGPLDILVGYRNLEDGEGFMAFEFEGADGDEPCGTPIERLRAGEKLAIQLHDGWLAGGIDLIDGRPYRPTRQEILEREALEESAPPEDPRLLPDDTGYYALGIGLDGDRLTIEPVAVACGMNGESLLKPAVFPESLRRRIGAFLSRLA